MPIKGLSDQLPSFPRLGTLRKGAAKTKADRPGSDLNELFRFVGVNDATTADFIAVFGTDEPATVNILLSHADIDDNFDAWVEEYKAGALEWRGDGERLVVARHANGYNSWHLGDPSAPLQPEGGKATGRLKVIIPELKRLGYVVVTTTSVHDIKELSGNLKALQALRGSLQGVPLVLSRVPREISTPSGKDGKRARREKWLIHLEADPAWVQLQLASMQSAALPAPARGVAQIANGIDVETGEIIDDDDDDFDQQDPTLRGEYDALIIEAYSDEEREGKRAGFHKNLHVSDDDELTDEQLKKLINGLKGVIKENAQAAEEEQAAKASVKAKAARFSELSDALFEAFGKEGPKRQNGEADLLSHFEVGSLLELTPEQMAEAIDLLGLSSKIEE